METKFLKQNPGAILKNFDRITLNEMNEVKLLNRYDSKYILHKTELTGILSQLSNFYQVLQVDDTLIQTYHSVYFDTPADSFYLTHHNGKAGRFKVRKREYVNSGLSFAEVKYKSNKGKTSKQRIASNQDLYKLSAAEKNFLKPIVNKDISTLSVKLTSHFNRITLVNYSFTERCTIDSNLIFENNDQILILSDLVIIELKQDEHNQHSKLAETLRSYKIQPCSFSKYCIGRALLEPNLKRNRFKPKILKIAREYKSVYCTNQAVSA